MGIDEDSIKNQLTDLFRQTNDLTKSVTRLEEHGKHVAKFMEKQEGVQFSLNETVGHIKKSMNRIDTILFGDPKMGTKGIVLEHNKMWEYTKRVTILLGISVFVLKELGVWDKIIT